MYLNKFRFDKKVAVITGAGRGIGFATADALSEAGATVVITDKDENSAAAARDLLLAKGRKSFSMKLDVTSSREVECV